MTKLSVIVPVFNTDKYLKKCLDSILAQTFSDFELILIDDGSTDLSGQICDDYSEKDSRIIVIHKDNTGVADSRNLGLKKATGELVTFVDSDDYCDYTMFEHAMESLKRNDCDLLISGYVAVDENDKFAYEGKRIVNNWELNNEKQTVDYIINNVLLPDGNGWEVWSSVFSRRIIIDHNIKFCTSCHNFAEDMGFMLEYLLFCKSVISIPYSDYRYVRHSGSMMDNSRDMIKLDSMNEVAIHFGNLFFESIKSNKERRRYAIIYYLIMNDQYSKMILYDGDCKKALEIDKQISNIEWHDKWMKKLICHRKELEIILGRKKARIAILNARLVSHRNWRRYSIESYITWKFLLHE